MAWYYDTLEDLIGAVHAGVLGDVIDGRTDHNRLRTTVARIKAFFPSRWRKKLVLCPVTGEEVGHPYGLSKTAWELMRDGLELRRRRDETATHTYVAHYLWLHVDGVLGADGNRHQGHSSTYDVLTSVAALLNVRTGHWRLEEAEKRGAIWLHDPALRFERAENDLYTIELTERQAAALTALGAHIRQQYQAQTARAFEIGSNWIVRMAEGSVSIDAVNALSRERDKAKRER